MSEYIVISRKELRKLLKNTIIEAHELGCLHQDIDDLEVEMLACVTSLPTGWLPISNAPKDGTWVLVAKSNGSAWIVSCCFWRVSFWEDANGHDFNIGINEPTHFLPLIEPTEK